jgi:tetratricopeptide (TPR) repeat protein
LAALSAKETEQLIFSLIAPDDVAAGEAPSALAQLSRRIFEETGGQPLFLVETLKTLLDEGLFQSDTSQAAGLVDWSSLDELMRRVRVLPGIREIIRGWLESVSAPAGEMLTAAAVLGHQASFEHLCHVAGLEERQALNALDQLLTRQLLQEATEASPLEPGRDPIYSFSHQKLSEVVYGEAAAARRRILHRPAFEALRDSAAPAPELSHHALQAGLFSETVRFSIAAGNEAMGLVAVRGAIGHYETAWRLALQKGWPEAVSDAAKQDLLAGIGRAYELIEEWSKAQEIYQAMIAAARTTRNPMMECLGLNRLATVFINGFNDVHGATVLLQQARELAERHGDLPGLAETEWNLSAAARMGQDVNAAHYHGEQALILARRIENPELLARCLNSLAYVQAHQRRWEAVEAYAGEARDLYAAAGNRTLEMDSLRLVGWSQMYTGQPQRSLATLEETLAFGRRVENAWGQAESAWRLALTMLELGRYGEALELATQAVDRARTIGLPAMVLLSLSALGVVQRTVMARDAARQTFLQVLEESREKGLTRFFVEWVLAELCALHAIAGEWEPAHEYARKALESHWDPSLPPMGLTGWHETEALFRGGDGDLARAEAARMSKLIGENIRSRLPLLRSLAVIARKDGDTDKEVQHLQAAAALAEAIALPGEEWQIQSALGTSYAELGDRANARQAWDAATAIVLGLAETIEDEAMRAGFLSAEAIRTIPALRRRS